MADEQLSPLPSAEGYDVSQPGTVVLALGDHLGTIRDLAIHDDDVGVTTVANHRVYDSFGNLHSQTNAAVDCLFGFTGRPLDRISGLQNNLNRWYDAEVGRWMSKDPIGFEGHDANTYRYVGNSLTNATDPSGLDKKPELQVLAVDATNKWTWEEFLNAITATKPGDVVRYYGHCTSSGKELIFKDPNKKWWETKLDGRTSEDIHSIWGPRGASIFIIQACGTDRIAGELAAVAKERKPGICAVIGTNIATKDVHARSLVGWFLEALHKDKTIQASVDHANSEMKKVWKSTPGREQKMPQLTCHGPGVNFTLKGIWKWYGRTK